MRLTKVSALPFSAGGFSGADDTAIVSYDPREKSKTAAHYATWLCCGTLSPGTIVHMHVLVVGAGEGGICHEEGRPTAGRESQL